MTAPPPALPPRQTAVRSPSHCPSLDCDLGQGAVVAGCEGAAEDTAKQGQGPGRMCPGEERRGEASSWHAAGVDFSKPSANSNCPSSGVAKRASCA